MEVLAELFRVHGYAASRPGEMMGSSGRRHPLPLLLERDARRVAVTAWLHRQPLGAAFVREFLDAVRDTGCDGGLIVSLGALADPVRAEAARERIQVWDSRRVAEELGHGVLRETVPDLWEVVDPLMAPRPSRLLDLVHQGPPAPATAPPAPPPRPVDAAAEPPFPAAVPPLLANPDQAPAATLELPAAFGALDQAAAGVLPEAPTAPPPPSANGPPGRRGILRVHVSKALATSLAKAKTRTIDRLFLRLVPHHVFDYEASLVVEGTVETQKREGRMAVDAALKRVVPWTRPLDVADLPADGVDVDEKPVRIAVADARKLLVADLRTLVTRSVVFEEDASEWSVMVRKKVELADEDLRLAPVGLFWVPIWRASGKEGSVEIDAATGQVILEETTVPRSDAQLL